jgi:transposase
MIYRRRSRLNGKQQGRLIDLFVAGATARAAAEIAGVNRNTARTFYRRLRQLIASKLPSYDLSGEVEADESYFGGVRKGQRGRAAAGKVPVFGLLKRGGKVFTAIIPNAKARTLLPIIREQVPPDSIVYTEEGVLPAIRSTQRRSDSNLVSTRSRSMPVACPTKCGGNRA